MAKVIICAGGPNPALDQLRIKEEDILIGVDRGAYRLIKAGFTLTHAFGDFDSVSASELAFIEEHTQTLHRYPSEKDDTDLQLALLYVLEHYSQYETIAIYGALGGGGRVDHFLANIWLVLEPRFENIVEKLHFIEAQHQARFYQPGHHQLLNPSQAKYLSIISLNPVSSWQIKGAKYNLPATDFKTPAALISNEFIPNHPVIELSFTKGMIVVMWVQDDH
ncbi:thiamine diphosphokinase [Globicatella sanguinis]